MKHFLNQVKLCGYGVLLAATMAMAGTAQTVESQQPIEREVLLTLTVTNSAGLPIKGLKPEHFKITSDKKPLQTFSFSDREEPISVAFLIDISGSMAGGITNGNDLRFYMSGITNFMREGDDANEYAVLSFNNETRLALEWTQDRRAVEQALAGIALQPAKGQTALYDACRQAVDLTSRSKHRKRVVIMLSDGHDTASKDARFRKLKEQVRASDAIFYGIMIVAPDARFLLDAQGQGTLGELAETTGGVALFPKGQFELEASFEVLGRLLRNQYVVGVKVAQSDEKKWHPIKVEIKLPPNAPRELKFPVVRHRAGYFDRVEQSKEPKAF